MSQKFIFVNTDGDYEESAGAYEVSDFINVSTGSADAGKPIVLDSDGKIDDSMIDASGIDHGELAGLGDDDHTQYILVDGTRAFTGNVNLGDHLIVNVTDPTNPQDAATKNYVDNIAAGLRPHAVCEVATTANIDLTTTVTSIDNYTLQDGDRVLVWKQTDAKENGVYVWSSADSKLTRAADFDGDGEVYRGSFVPEVLHGDTYAKHAFIVIQSGTNSDGSIKFGTDDVVFDTYSTPIDWTGTDGIILDHTNNTVSIDLLDTDSGLGFFGAAYDELGIDWASTFTIDGADDKAFMASDLASTATGEGASIVGVEDANGYFTSDNVEGVLAELYTQASTPIDTNSFTAGEDITKGDLVYIDSNDTVKIHPGTSSVYAIGIAKDSVTTGNVVEVLKDDTILTGILTNATPGTKYYWDGSAWATSLPIFSGFYVWRLGCAKNASDAYVDLEFVKRNS
jgi:hypothetical protein